MKRYVATLLFPLVALPAIAQLSFDGADRVPVSVTPASSTGLEAIYVAYRTEGLRLSWQEGTSVKWFRFGSSGAAYAEQISEGTSITLSSGDTGIIVETEGRSHYYWIADYSLHPFSASTLEPLAEQNDCARLQLSFTGSADRMLAYTINGRPEEINREITLEYNTLRYDSDAANFVIDPIIHKYSSINSIFSVDAPLCDTHFTLSGDRFLHAWGQIETIESSLISAAAISAETSAEQTERTNDNEQQVTGALLGGSAPCEITFNAVVSDAVAFYEWQFSTYPEFDEIDNRFNQTELTYIFRDMGTTYVRFFAADASGNCTFSSQTYEVVIGESAILCPNAFSPQSSPGVNDEWKVSYKSITSFDCHIFNRWGVELFSTKDPAVGWDGRHKGKYVPAGTYYYVIKARGADGRNYNLSGDINIINSKSIISSDND